MNVTPRHVWLISLSMILGVVGLCGLIVRGNDVDQDQQVEVSPDLALIQWVDNSGEFQNDYLDLEDPLNDAANLVAGDSPEELNSVATDIREETSEVQEEIVDAPNHYFFILLKDFLDEAATLSSLIKQAEVDGMFSMREEEFLFEQYLVTVEAFQDATAVLKGIGIEVPQVAEPGFDVPKAPGTTWMDETTTTSTPQ